jgi:flagellar biosynthesis/type III secretory pathway protein FliH
MDIQWKDFFLEWKIKDEDFKKAIMELVDQMVVDEGYDQYNQGYEDGRSEGYDEGYEDGREEAE